MEEQFALVHVQVHHNLTLFRRSRRMVSICRMGRPPKPKKNDTILLDMHALVPELVEEWVSRSLEELPLSHNPLQMYTANTMASAAEVLGMTLPGSSSFPAESEEKLQECRSVGPAILNLLEKNILPRDIMTRTAFENALVNISPTVFTNEFSIELWSDW
jgi:Dehydratase family